MKLWLDDERPAPQGWVWVKTAVEAIHHLESFRHAPTNQALWDHQGMSDFWTISHMSFDHDLADVRAAKEMTGYDVLLWMAEHNVWPTEACYVHTHNSAAQKKMCQTIDRYGPYEHKVRWTPYVAPV